MAGKINKNERSWGIEIISDINSFTKSSDLIIKHAGGEFTVSIERTNSLFPDVLLYGNNDQTVVLQGWELKMPDVPIEDQNFIQNAAMKARALNLNSFVLWNFTYVVLYVQKEDNTFSIYKQWDNTSFIRTREDVTTHQDKWKQLLESIIVELNGFFIDGRLHKAPLNKIISENTITTLIKRNKDLIADKLRDDSFKDAVMNAYIDQWWIDFQSEYKNDETDKYKAYAKTIILNWANRITFAHIIKERQNSARLIDNLDYSSKPSDANAIFNEITSKCDFYNVFSNLEYDECIPIVSWQDFVDYSCFLKDSDISCLPQSALQNILEESVSTCKRARNGQYTTPTELANILLSLSVKNWEDPILDCCCGTGTIPKAAIQYKKQGQSVRAAVESVWACDKYKYPLQIANISMVDTDTINIANRIFQHNALTLKPGEIVEIVNPETGEKMKLTLPVFGTIVSNLPFVESKNIPEDDKALISNMNIPLDDRADLYCSIAIKISEMIKDGGILGIIISNSWMGTDAGVKFINAVKNIYNIKQVHISGKGKWFKNADVVTTILILEKKGKTSSSDTCFWLWKKSLEDFSSDTNSKRILTNSAFLEKELNPQIVKLSKYSSKLMDNIIDMNVCYNALFHKVDWILEIKNKLVPINNVFDVFRGSRRGWDKLFYPASGQHEIEDTYLKKVLKNPPTTSKLNATADANAFCCGKTIDELNQLKHFGAVNWINKFSNQVNNTNRPLPEVLSRRGMQWYELQDKEIAEIFTLNNPFKKIFFSRFNVPSFINQRLIGFNHKDCFPDIDLDHALLNSMLTIFFVEAAGFGRGQGVLDVNKEKISKCRMLNPQLVQLDRDRIITAFEKIKSREILELPEELEKDDRIEFEHTVLSSFGIDLYFDKIKSSLISMFETRMTVINE